MAQIVLMIPRKSGVKAPPFSAPPSGSLPFVAGECVIDGYENLILIESVEWDAGVTTATSSEGRRTVQSPKLSSVKISRHVDMATASLTQSALAAQVGQYPWEIYFLKAFGGSDADTETDGHMQARFLTVKLYFPLITNYTFEVSEGYGEETIEVAVTALEWIYQQVSDDQRIIGQKALKFDVQQGTFT